MKDDIGFWLYRRPYVLTPTGRKYLVYPFEPRYGTFLVKPGADHQLFGIYDPTQDGVLRMADLRIDGSPLSARSIRVHHLKDGLRPEVVLDHFVSRHPINIVIPPNDSGQPLYFLDGRRDQLLPFFAGAQTVTLPAGTKLFHGGLLSRIPVAGNRPMWLSPLKSTAETYAQRYPKPSEATAREGGAKAGVATAKPEEATADPEGGVVTYVLKADLTLYVLAGDNYDRFRSQLDGSEASYDPEFYYGQMISKEGSTYYRQSQHHYDNMFAGLLCGLGFDGYSADVMMSKKGKFEAEVMICQPSRWLVDVK